VLVSQILKDKGDLVFTASPQETVGAAAALLHTIEVYGSARNRKGISIEAAVRDWARRDAQAVAVVDLTQAYQPHADHAVRTFNLQDRKRLVLTDDLHARQPAEFWWFLHTDATVGLDDQGRTATLTQHGKTLRVRLQEPAEAAFEVMDCRPLPTSPNPEPQADNRNRRKLAIHLENVKAVRIQVALE